MSDAPSQQPVVEMNGVRVTALRDASVVVLENVNWTVRPGEFWVVAGPQHSGKSDLLLHAAGLVTPAEGVCRVFGSDTNGFGEDQLAQRLRVGFAFADGKLFDQLSLAENIALPLQYHRDLPEAELAELMATLLDWLELAPYANLIPGAVAPVWRQRAALGRALALKPELLLLDNPIAGLTARHRRWLVDFLDQLWKGHDWLGRRPATIVVTVDDLHAWEQPRRHFAAAHQGAFTALGAWGDPEFARHQIVQELLATPSKERTVDETIRPAS